MTDEAFEKRNAKGLELQITIPILPGKQGSVRIKSSSSNKKSNTTQKKQKTKQ